MEIAKTYNPAQVEDKWYAYWIKHKFFASKPNPAKKPYTVVIPPPNITGVLHMGHMLNNTIQDVLVRRKRMQGFEACWVPGTDHASIATEAKVVKMLKEEKNIDKKDLTREEFLRYAWEWKEKYGGIILKQLEKLGASCDWNRTRFTMEEKLSAAVIRVFVDLYKKGYIYRGIRMVNWDPQGKTALSDEEVIFKETRSKLYYVKYPLVDSTDYLVIATTRPETIMGDVAVCVNPSDERYQRFIGKEVIVPIVNRKVPIIADNYVDMSFGTGCLKITPAHDPADYEIGLRHQLPSIDVITEDGKISSQAGIFVGEDRFKARKLMIQAIEEAGLLEKIEEITHNVGYSERTDAVIEPKLSTQWFVKMKELIKPAWENVMNDNIRLHPEKFKNMYNHWMENVKDWCISRQLWWGQRIPAYYLPDGRFVVAETLEEAFEQAKLLPNLPENFSKEDLRQDEDVLDTWFSSWLWPISVFDGFEDYNPQTGKIEIRPNSDLAYYYPTDDLVTAPEILFFWVARMIMAGYEYIGEKPFKNVYLTGIVRDKLRRKMSKSLGNSPDPLDLIAKYGADAVRTGMLFSSPAGNDLLYDEKLVEQGRNFCNKIWNAFRLIKSWKTSEDTPQLPQAVSWFEAKLHRAYTELEKAYEEYRLSDALMIVYKLIWDDFCSWYLEMIKPEFGRPIHSNLYQSTIFFFESLCLLLHPFMPFITEEIWQHLQNRVEGESICKAAYPHFVVSPQEENILKEGEILTELITHIRNVRNTKGISPKQHLELTIKTTQPKFYEWYEPIIKRMANISAMHFSLESVPNAVTFVIKSDEFFLPIPSNLEQEREQLLKELEYMKGFKNSVLQKLSNEKFMSSAPTNVIEREKQKLLDAEAKIAALEKALFS
ncbi:MAG: valine--tRNA ligase [Cytophagales bacterium]|nr:valine--tRNA ligase [Cytophagales bacterium]MDW8384764.1 valine--tRNA ligase [Flammeovirgaceae bacterium]